MRISYFAKTISGIGALFLAVAAGGSARAESAAVMGMLAKQALAADSNGWEVPAQPKAETASPSVAASSFAGGETWALGTRFIPLKLSTVEVSPAVTLRHWLTPPAAGSQGMGFDVGLGVLLDTGEGSANTNAGFSVLGGFPIALATYHHACFELVPEINLALLHVGAGDGSTAIHVDVGARAGFEVTFGFIGIPQLALDASVGAQLALNAGGGGPTRFLATTTFNNAPWDIFKATVAARYYF